MRRSDLAQAAESAVNQIAKILPELQPAHRDAVLPGLSLLAVLSELDTLLEQTPSSRLQRFATLHGQLNHLDAGERLTVIRERLGISRSSFYRLLDEARTAGLVPNQSHSSPK